MLQPLRLGPLVIPLVFFLQLVRRVRELADAGGGRAVVAPPLGRARRRSGIVIATTVTSPLLAAPRMVARTVARLGRPRRRRRRVPLDRRPHRPDSLRCVVPIDRQDAFERGERPIVANWQAIRYDDVAGWKRRVDALVGGAGFFGAEDQAADLRRAPDGLRPS